MNDQRLSPRLYALPVQVLETTRGVILKRGTIEVKIIGLGAVEVVHDILKSLAHGHYTREELCQKFQGPAREAIDDLIGKLIKGHMLIEGEAPDHILESRESHIEIFYGSFGKKLADINEQLNGLHFAILGVNHVSCELVKAFERSGIENFEVIDYPLLRNLRLFSREATLITARWPLSKSPLEYTKWKAGLDSKRMACLIATSDFGSRLTMRDWNRFCIERKQQFLPIVLHELVGYVGPLVIPGETACYECLYARQNSHLSSPEDQFAADQACFEGQVINGFHPSMPSMLADIATIELTKFFGGALPFPKAGSIVEVNLMGPQVTARKLLKIPRCAVCSPLHAHSPSMISKYGPSKSASKCT